MDRGTTTSGVHVGRDDRGQSNVTVLTGRRSFVGLVFAVAGLTVIASTIITVHSPSAHAAVAEATALGALVAAWLSWDRLRRVATVGDVLQVSALLCFGLSAAAGAVLGGMVDAGAEPGLLAAPMIGQLFAGLLFVAAGLANEHLADPVLARPGLGALILGSGPVLIAVLIAGAFGHSVGATPNLRPEAMTDPVRVVAFLELINCGLFACAGLESLRRSSRLHAKTWLSTGALYALAGAQFDRLGMPLLGGHWLTLRDLLLAAAAAMFCGTAAFELADSGRHATRIGGLAERRRIARDLHDGIVQDLSLIAAHAARLAGEHGENHPVVMAARRATDLTRGVIAELSDLDDVPIGDALEIVAVEIAERHGLAVQVEVSTDLDLPKSARSDLLRIVREAITNAGRHGEASRVRVVLEEAGGHIVLRVTDDGRGFGGGSPKEGFGLRSSRARAEAIGADLTIREPESGGTELIVALP